jgi:hypothetical protein
LWSAFQFCRLFTVYVSISNVFCENAVVITVFVVTLGEKVVGSIFDCSRAQIEAEWLVSVALPVAHEHSVSVLKTPVFWFSVGGLLSACSGNIIKIVVDMMDDANRISYVTFSVFFFVFCSIYLQVMMIRGIRKNKRD